MTGMPMNWAHELGRPKDKFPRAFHHAVGPGSIAQNASPQDAPGAAFYPKPSAQGREPSPTHHRKCTRRRLRIWSYTRPTGQFSG